MTTPAVGGEAPIHSYLRERLTERFGGNVSKLAYACDTTPSMAAKWVSDDPRRRVTPSPASCRKIARGLGAELDYILALAGYRELPSATERQTDPRLAELWAHVEAGWQTLDEAARAVAERGTKALFKVEDVRTLPKHRRRVTDDGEDLGRSNRSGNQSTLKRRPYKSASVASLRAQYGFQPYLS